MSDTCGNCSCADKSQCVKKGNQYGFDLVEAEMSYDSDIMYAAENDCKCGCSSGSCSCNGCGCSCH